MDIECERKSGCSILTIIGERVDAACAVQFKDSVNGYLNDSAPRVILNFENVTFVDSSGLGAIVSIYKGQLGTRKIDLCYLNPAVEKVFKLTRMDQVFNIFNDLTIALNADQAA